MYESEMLNAKRVLVFSPHPDDAEIIAGGYLYRKATEEKKDVKLIVVTDGSKGYSKLKFKDIIKELRRDEQFEAARRLGIKDVELLDYEDLNTPPPELLRESFLRIIRQYKPEIVITVDPTNRYESHPDHINVGRAVMQAVLFSNLQGVAEYVEALENPPLLALGATDNPNAVICLTEDEVFMKLEGIRAHISQFKESQVQYIFQIVRELGKKYGCEYAETFHILSVSDLHMSI